MRKIRVFSGADQSSRYISCSIIACRKVSLPGLPATASRKWLEAEKSVGLWTWFRCKDSAIVSEFAGKKIVREPVPIAKEEPLKLELQSFVACVREKQTPIVSGESAKRALDLEFEITRQIQQIK